MTKPHAAFTLLVAAISLFASAAACAAPPATAPATARVVDEPIGARYSLGMTLWHLGHDPDAIRGFHRFLKESKVEPLTLLSPDERTPPSTFRRVLVEPELLAPQKLAGWKVEGGLICSPAGDYGTTVSFPVTIDRAGLYRLWVRYYAWPTGSAVTHLTLRKSGREAFQPLASDEVYDLPAEKEGLAWKSILVDLEAGNYTASIGPVTRRWHTNGTKALGFLPRKMDCLYLTDEIWAEAPDEAALQKMKAASPPSGLQWSARPPVDPESRAAAQLWRVRPVAWEEAQSQPRLFELSRSYWRARVAEAAGRPWADEHPPDYREPERQVIFDDDWNMAANPLRIRRQVEALRSDITAGDTTHEWHWLHPGEFEKVAGQWRRSGDTLTADWSAHEGVAEQALKVETAGEHHVWVRFRQINHQETWKFEAADEAGNTVAFTRDQLKYEPDILASSAWQKVGTLRMPAGGTMRLKISLLPVVQPATYHFVYDVSVTTDADYRPRGTLRPPLSLGQYAARAKRLGAEAADGYVMRVAPGLISMGQDWWPRAAEREDPDDARPTRREAGAKGEGPALLAPEQALVMARDSHQSVQLYLRSLRDKPTTLTVDPGEWRDAAGKSFPGHVDWRVVAFVPFGNSRQQWSPFALLRRPTITIPPLNAAQVWLTVDTMGLPPGDYTTNVTLRSAGLPAQVAPLRVHVAPFAATPKEPILISGYTSPPEGEEYLRSSVEHGMNVLFSPMPKAEMTRLGIRLLLLQQHSADPAELRTLIDRLKALGLGYDDYAMPIRDEPTAVTPEALKPYIDVAKAIHAIDPKVRVSFNPGEAAKLATFEALDPFCEFWLPYSLHAFYVVDLQKKIDIYSKKPWMWYTTPCLHDKSPSIASELFNQIRLVPTMPGLCKGTAFFAFYYPFRDAWDAGYEHIPDASVMMLPSRHGPVFTPALEGIREGKQAASLATMVKERAAADDAEAAKLIKSGSVRELVEWLEARGVN